MSAGRSDALVLLGATGDIAHRKIYPALVGVTVLEDPRPEPSEGMSPMVVTSIEERIPVR